MANHVSLIPNTTQIQQITNCLDIVYMAKDTQTSSKKNLYKDPNITDNRIDLTTSVQFLKGVGPKRAKSFTRLGIHTVADLIKHVPHRYEYEYGLTPIGSLVQDQLITTQGEIASIRFIPRGRKPRFEATIEDNTGHIHLVWFHGLHLRGTLRPGMIITVTGKTAINYGFLQMINPKWTLQSENPDDRNPANHSDSITKKDRYRPIYPATEEINSNQIDHIIQNIIKDVIPLIEDHFTLQYCKKHELLPLAEAYKVIHSPISESDVAEARRRLIYDELIMLQTGIAIRRHELRHKSLATALMITDQLEKQIRDLFSFKLTSSQDKVIADLRKDLSTSIPMNRLLQGDVGSGKTVIALYAMLAAAFSNCQAALLAPTEILAEQHYSTICQILEKTKLNVRLLTGTIKPAIRESIYNEIRTGKCDLLIGTHALFNESIQFKKLAVTIIDEQHRFGVEQRAILRKKSNIQHNKNEEIPHTLVMTATPIPRTLSLTLFGDLDVSIIEDLPPGRMPITTRWVTPDQCDTVYEYLAKRIRENNEQAYIILPAIDESSDPNHQGLKDVKSHLEWLEQGHFSGLRIAAMHGRLKRESRERIMYRFRSGKINALVATTVIEVGVDVPNASLMVIEHAERFGLSQLHQLRGRIGRGTNKSLCTLIGNPNTEESHKRLQAIAQTTDGFVIAEKDFEIRGMGEILGTRQSGLTPFKFVEFPRDFAMLNLAKRDAQQIIQNDPDLSNPENQLLRKRLMKIHGKSLGIADVG